MIDSMHKATPENIDEKIGKVEKLKIQDPTPLFATFKFFKELRYNDILDIRKTAISEMSDKLKETYMSDLESARQEVLFHLKDFKKTKFGNKELVVQKTIAQADEERESNDQITDLEVDINKDSKIGEVLFEGIAAPTTDLPEVRKGYEIKVLERSGYAALVAYWFTVIGREYEEEKFARKTIGSMIKDLEKHAHKTNEKLDNPNIRYEAKVKAVNRK